MRNKIVFLATAVALSCSLAVAQAQFKVLYSFGGSPQDGSLPVASLISDSAGNLYGTTQSGGNTANCPGNQGCGTIFKLSPNSNGGWTETVLYSFCIDFNGGECADGYKPEAGLLLDRAGNLYGTTLGGGTCSDLGTGNYGCGTLFELSPPSLPGGIWTETVLYDFCSNYVNRECIDGFSPESQLIRGASGTIYGTTSGGGTGHAGGGTVFKLSEANGAWHLTTLYNFCSLGQGRDCPDGTLPAAGVTFDKLGNLYGTTSAGGQLGDGTVYKLSPAGDSWKEVVVRNGGRNGIGPTGTVSIDASGNLYSTASGGGPAGGGSVFRLTANGGGTFLFFDNSNQSYLPASGVLLDSKRNALYGTTEEGGTGSGNVYQIVPPSQMTSLYSFCSQQNCEDGASPVASLIEDSSGNLYGTTKFGGTSTNCQGGCGVVFEIVQSQGAENRFSTRTQRWHTILPAQGK